MPQGNKNKKRKQSANEAVSKVKRAKASDDLKSPMVTRSRSKVNNNDKSVNIKSNLRSLDKNKRKIPTNQVTRTQTCNNNAVACDNSTDFIVGDGINVEANPGEDLDYVDDGQGDMSDFEEDTSQQDSADFGCGNPTEKQILENPGLRKLFNQLLDERIKQATKQGESSNSNLLSTLTPDNTGKSNGQNVQNVQSQSKRVSGQQNRVKSPSDTTIYAPAFTVRADLNRTRFNNPSVIEQQVSNFVDAVRAEQSQDIRRVSEVTVPGQK